VTKPGKARDRKGVDKMVARSERDGEFGFRPVGRVTKSASAGPPKTPPATPPSAKKESEGA
jgi:hypothetical protein